MSTNQRGTNFKYGLEIGDKSIRSNISLITALVVFAITLSPVAVAANTTAEQTFTVNGISATDLILDVIKPTAQAGLGIVGCRVSAANQAAITFSNNTAGVITPTAAEVYKIILIGQ
ncbi:MAG: hypothetical protein P4L49_02640 [Desulfosporosinus sp.]|nr:hypothetical protein [Desulfosporosinus sp.]